MLTATHEGDRALSHASLSPARSLEARAASDTGSFEVLIAGAGPAGVEAALTLQRIAGDRVTTTIVAPEERFVHLPPAVLSPFAAGGERLALDRLTGACLRRGIIVSVDRDAREVRLEGGEIVAYDALLIAVGGIQRSPYPRALAFGTPESEERMHGLIQDLEDGYIKRIAFVVPPAASWPLPLYELALLTAARAFDMCVDVELTLVTSEPSPLAVFGEAVSGEVDRAARGGRGDRALRRRRCGDAPIQRARLAPELCASRGRPRRDRTRAHRARDPGPAA